MQFIFRKCRALAENQVKNTEFLVFTFQYAHLFFLLFLKSEIIKSAELKIQSIDAQKSKKKDSWQLCLIKLSIKTP